MSKIYVGNLSWNTTDEGLRQAFAQYGQVLDSIVMRDRETGRSRGFGFVTYGSSQEAEAAIASVNETQLDGRTVKVNMANARTGGGGGGGPSYGGAHPGYGGGAYAGGASYGGGQGYPSGYGAGFGNQGSFGGGYGGVQPGYQGGGGYGYQQGY